MAGVNVTNVGTTYTNYEKGFIETLNSEARSHNMARKKKWTGKNIEGRIHLAWSTALGWSEDGGSFPSEDKNDYVAYNVGRRFFHAKIGLTNGVLATARRSPQVARDVLDSEVRGMMTAALKYYNGFFFKDGTGSVAELADAQLASSASDVPVDDSRMLWVGGEYDLYDATDSYVTKLGTVTVSDVEQSLDANGDALVNFDTTISTAAATDRLYWKAGS